MNADATGESITRQSREQVVASILDAAGARLCELGTLGHDWDSYGGDPPTPLAITRARQLLKQACERFIATVGGGVRPFAIAPTPDGGILIEWRTARRGIAILVGAAGALDFVTTEGEGEARRYQEAENVSWDLVLDLIGKTLQATTAA